MITKVRAVAWIVVALAFLCVGAQTLFGQFSSVTVALNVPRIGQESQLVARELDMKEGFAAGKPYAVKYVDEDKKERVVFPLVNLDIFFIDVEISGKRAVGFSRPGDAQRDITVMIPFSYIQKLAPAIKDPRSATLVFWAPKEGRWLSVKQLVKEVSAVGKVDSPEGGYLYFKIKDWPIDDRIIGCY